MASNQCPRCLSAFRDPYTLRRHMGRKTPCAPIVEKADLPASEQQKQHSCHYCGRAFTSKSNLNRHIRGRCRIATTEEGMDKLLDHVLSRRLEEQSRATEALTQQVAELTSLVRSQISLEPAPPAAQQRAGVIHNAPVIQVGVMNVALTCWNSPGGPLPEFTPEFLMRVFRSSPELVKYCGLPYDEQTSSEAAPPYVVRALVESVREAHKDPVYRNVYLNPKRADQALVCIEQGGEQCWEVREIAEATRTLFDTAIERMRRVTLDDAARVRLPVDIQDAAAWIPILYDYEPARYVSEARKPMSALLGNARPPRIEN